MAKKKKQQQKQFSPVAYLRSGKVRSLPIYECLMPKDWATIKKFPVLVARQHASGNITCGSYFVDLMCTGVKEVFFIVNEPPSEYDLLVEKYGYMDLDMQPVDYELAHNVIWGAEAYAAEFHIEPHSDFALGRMILEEDTDEIPLIEIPLGVDDKPMLILHPDEPRNAYFKRQMDKYAGVDGYKLMHGDIPDWDDEDYDEDYDEEFDEEDWSEYLNEAGMAELMEDVETVEEIYEKCIYLPAITGKQLAASARTMESTMKITYDAIDVDNFSQEELDKIEDLHRRIVLNNPSRSELKLILEEIQTAIVKWPRNQILRNYLINSYMMLGEKSKGYAEMERILADFPDYLFGKLTYAKMLLGRGKVDDIPALFNGEFSLFGYLPDRKEFHVSEFLSFNSIMGAYFLAKKDVEEAFTYYQMIQQVDWTEGASPMESFLMDMLDKMIEEVRKLIKQMRAGKRSEEEIIALLMD